MNIRYRIALVCLLVFGGVSSSFAQAPRTLSYQGYLVDAAKQPVSGQHTFTVRLYDVPNGGAALHTETVSGFADAGVFTVTLGKVTPISQSLGFDKVYYVGVSVDNGAELAPRTELTSAPYSMYAESVSPTAAVTSLNGVSGAVTLQGGGGTTVSANGNTITISSSGGGGTGIQGVQSTDGSLSVTNPNGPTATINIASGGVKTANLADGSVMTAKIGSNQITNSHIADASIALTKLAPMNATNGQYLKFNGAAWTPADIAGGGGGLTLPWAGSTGAGQIGFAETYTGTQDAMNVTVNNASHANGAITASTNGSGFAVGGTNTGSGTAAIFRIQNSANTNATVTATTDGLGKAIDVTASNTNNTAAAMSVASVGSGAGIYVYTSKSSSPNSALFAQSNSTAIFGRSDGTGGSSAVLRIYNANNASDAVTMSTAGTGIVANVNSTNASNSSVALNVTHSGTGTGIDATAASLGIHGKSSATTGTTSGIMGEALSTSNGTGANGGVTGVLGQVTPTSPGGYSAGVRGVNNGTSGSGIGVVGFQNGSGWGVYGETPSGFGVYGLTTNSSASSTGVRGETYSTNGIGVEAKYTASGAGVALQVTNGAIKVAGTNKAAFVHTATVNNKMDANGTDIDNALCNGDANCILFVTQKLNPATTTYNNSPIGVYYNTNRAKWEIFNENNAAIPTNAQFDVLVIKQ